MFTQDTKCAIGRKSKRNLKGNRGRFEINVAHIVSVFLVCGIFLLLCGMVLANNLSDYEEEATESLIKYNLNEKELGYQTYQRTQSYIAKDYRLGFITQEEGVRLLKELSYQRALDSGVKIIGVKE